MLLILLVGTGGGWCDLGAYWGMFDLVTPWAVGCVGEISGVRFLRKGYSVDTASVEACL